MLELENHRLAGIVSVKDHQWLQKLVGKSNMRKKIFAWFQHISPTGYVLITKGENS